MKAWLVERITQAGEMRLADVPPPEPLPGTYLVKVEAAGLNFLDTLMIRGRYQFRPEPPFTPGIEVAGRIETAGEGTELAPGTRVVGSMRTGGFAEYARVKADAVTALDDPTPAPEALALLGNFPTSLLALRDVACVRPGETVLVHAGAGSVGSAAVQLARVLGARVIATAGGDEKTALCRELGADLTIDYRNQDFVELVRRETGGEGADVIYDPVGGDVGEQSLRCLAWQGRYLVVGFAGGRITALPANRLLLKAASAIGIVWGEYARREPASARRVIADVFNLYRERKLRPLVRHRFPFAEAPAALAALAGRDTVGKVVLVF